VGGKPHPLHHISGEEYIDITPKTVHNLMSRLRQKLRVAPDTPDYIASVRGIGYQFAP
jgi:DNA-binding response OmpR family regulator